MPFHEEPVRRRGVRPITSAAPIGILAALLCTLSSCGSKTPTATPDVPSFIAQGGRVTIPAQSPLRTRLVIARVGDSDLGRQIAAPAVVEADPGHQARILTPIAGRIVTLGARLGDHVRAGEMLATLASPDLSSALADDAHAQAQLRLTSAARTRALGLKAIGGAADKDVQQAQADYAAAQAEATRTHARLRQLGQSRMVKGGGLALVAPAAGVVTDLAAAPGAYWTDLTAPLMTISNIGTVWVTANVGEADIASVHIGQPVQIRFDAFPDQGIAGRVQSIAPILDPDSRRTKVRIAIANPDERFKPGMFATVRFAAAAERAPSIPTSALLLKDDATTVFVEIAPWTFERRVVDTGDEQGDRTTIAHGLATGQRIIAKGGVLLDD
ncbi:efflux RND transporter periplasmic adaptor subunit [Sphingomonas sp.]|uniref:efflux RND transporter periplasmic adaptor subunit n=1 Tax=Sphingomonas sp. TaxID=28214 RepID=UPI003B3BB995